MQYIDLDRCFDKMVSIIQGLLFCALVSLAAASCISNQQRKRYCYTRWLDRDNPSGSGDYEVLTHMAKSQVCTRPVGAQCQTVNGKPYNSTGNVLATKCDPQYGLVCVNSQQPAGTCCQDYRVRFLCPEGTIQDTRGIFCEDYCESRFYNRDHPSGKCDCEQRSISAYRGPTPVGIKCIERTTRKDYRDIGQKMTCTPDYGGVCWNHKNPGNHCKDYSVQYIYPCQGTEELEAEVEEFDLDKVEEDPEDIPSIGEDEMGAEPEDEIDDLLLSIFN